MLAFNFFLIQEKGTGQKNIIGKREAAKKGIEKEHK